MSIFAISAGKLVMKILRINAIGSPISTMYSRKPIYAMPSIFNRKCCGVCAGLIDLCCKLLKKSLLFTVPLNFRCNSNLKWAPSSTISNTGESMTRSAVPLQYVRASYLALSASSGVTSLSHVSSSLLRDKASLLSLASKYGIVSLSIFILNCRQF